ncbi:MAG: choline ABC transporter permease, partial [Ilumatobacteraceae bacterium]
MTAVLDALPSALPDDIERARRTRRIAGFAVFAALVVAAALLPADVPSWWDLGLQEWMQDRYTWTVFNRETSPVFTLFLNPVSSLLTWSVGRVESLLALLEWPGVIALGGAIGWRTGGTRAGMSAAAALVGVGLIADWDLAMLTLA